MHQPRKRFGQNFLHDEQAMHAIVALISPRPGQHLVEIGPGRGALTRSLLRECKRLDVVELDRDLVEYLQGAFAGEEKLRIHSADALRFDFRTLADGGKMRVVGNLPYNISTPLLFHLFEQSEGIEDMHFMLQKEVVDRLCAEPGGKDYGRLSVMARYWCDIAPLMDVHPESFYPRPKVISTVARLLPHADKPVEIAPKTLRAVTTAAFSQRRKTLRNALGGLLDEKRIAAAGIDPGARAETLSLEDFARLGALLNGK
jgi:16S rRNA (adenine1518-N6/adenine1519-N6)-dimethyltransferase